MSIVSAMKISGREVLPLIEGGKGIAISTGLCSGAWAAEGCIGTFSGVNADTYDEKGNILPQIYKGKTRQERFQELVNFAIKGGIEQAKLANDASGGKGRIHMNILWEMGGAEKILENILDGAKGLIHGVTCGAGMPYHVGELASKHGVYYYPIVSSARAFRALWIRAFHKFSDWLGGVVYEDPWLAGGHNGLSNSEDPKKPEDPFPRLLALRKFMNENGLKEVPIVMAGGVWCLDDWKDYINNKDIGPIAFQFGTRPMLTKESPISDAWKQRLLTLKKGDVFLNRFSPTGFYSSAVNNDFIQELRARAERQIPYSATVHDDKTSTFSASGKTYFVTPDDLPRAEHWVKDGFTAIMKTPDSTLIFVTPERAESIRKIQASCMGCLSACQFSGWAQNDKGTTGRMPDPRSFCIQETLQKIAHTDDIENSLMFAGHNAYRFALDSFYANGFIPTMKQLIDRILTGK